MSRESDNQREKKWEHQMSVVAFIFVPLMIGVPIWVGIHFVWWMALLSFFAIYGVGLGVGGIVTCFSSSEASPGASPIAIRPIQRRIPSLLDYAPTTDERPSSKHTRRQEDSVVVVRSSDNSSLPRAPGSRPGGWWR